MMKRSTFVSLWLSLLLSGVASADPAAIILFRHGEEPPPPDKHLSAIGQARAKAIPFLVKSRFEITSLPPIAAIYAAHPVGPDSSFRSIETMQPLSKFLGLPINHNFNSRDTKGLVKELRSRADLNGKTVVLAWTHHHLVDIPEILNAEHTPDKWHGSDWDSYWIIRFDPKGKDDPVLSVYKQDFNP